MDYRFAPGTAFAGYTIDGPIGSGSVGETYRARRAGTRITVALKVAWPELAAVQGFAFEMQRLAKILHNFRHPHICAVLDSGISKGVPFWASEYVPGPRGEPFTLRDYLADRVERGKVIEEEEIFITAGELVDTLAALHAFRDKEECPEGFALGDLRPANILLDAETRFRLCDLGLSALVRAATHSFPGTKSIGVGYMSPEVRACELPSVRSDVYSIGAIIYELLTGQKFSADALPPSKLRKGIKAGWDGLLMNRCLTMNPEDRLADMAALKTVLANIERAKVGKTIVLTKDAVRAIPAEDEEAPALQIDRSAETKPRTMMVRKIGSESGNPQTIRTQVGISKRAPGPVSQEVAQAETISFHKPPARSPYSPAVAAPKKKTGVWIALAVVAAACAAGFPAYYFATKKPAAAAVATNVAIVATKQFYPVAGQPWTISSFGVEMKWIPPATALIGSDEDEQKAIEPNLPESESHVLGYERKKEVGLSNGFWMAQTEVTIGQWKQFVAANAGYETFAERKGEALSIHTNGSLETVQGVIWSNPFPGHAVADSQPVTCVLPSDMQAFCAWLTNRERDAGRIGPVYAFRLPTEFEWEDACRGGEKKRTAYWWGSDANLGSGRINAAGAEFSKLYPARQKYGFTWNDPFERTAPVGSFGEKGLNGYGLADMLGNVWECVTRPDLPGQQFSWRGGSFAEGYTIVRTASVRHRYTDTPSANAGFRLCLSK